MSSISGCTDDLVLCGRENNSELNMIINTPDSSQGRGKTRNSNANETGIAMACDSPSCAIPLPTPGALPFGPIREGRRGHPGNSPACLGTSSAHIGVTGRGVWPAPALCLGGQRDQHVCVAARAELFFAAGLIGLMRVVRFLVGFLTLLFFSWLLKLKAAVFFSKVGMTASSAD